MFVKEWSKEKNAIEYLIQTLISTKYHWKYLANIILKIVMSSQVNQENDANLPDTFNSLLHQRTPFSSFSLNVTIIMSNQSYDIIQDEQK